MAYKIAGGSKWWQVRAGHGVEAEWIVMKDEYRRSEWQQRKHRHDMRKETKRSESTPKVEPKIEEQPPPEGEEEIDSGCELIA